MARVGHRSTTHDFWMHHQQEHTQYRQCTHPKRTCLLKCLRRSTSSRCHITSHIGLKLACMIEDTRCRKMKLDSFGRVENTRTTAQIKLNVISIATCHGRIEEQAMLITCCALRVPPGARWAYRARSCYRLLKNEMYVTGDSMWYRSSGSPLRAKCRIVPPYAILKECCEASSSSVFLSQRVPFTSVSSSFSSFFSSEQAGIGSMASTYFFPVAILHQPTDIPRIVNVVTRTECR